MASPTNQQNGQQFDERSLVAVGETVESNQMANRLNGILGAYQYQNGHLSWTQHHHIYPIAYERRQWAPEAMRFRKSFHQICVLGTGLRNYIMESSAKQKQQKIRGILIVCYTKGEWRKVF